MAEAEAKIEPHIIPTQQLANQNPMEGVHFAVYPCSQCGEQREKKCFSKKQWKKKADRRKCLDCVSSGAKPNTNPTQNVTPRIPEQKPSSVPPNSLGHLAKDKGLYRIHFCEYDTSKQPLKGRILQNHVTDKQFDGAIPQSDFERFIELGVDNRTIVNDFFKAEQYSSMVKMIMTFRIHGKLIDFQGTGQIVNLNLGEGKVSKCYVQTAGHNFVIKSSFDGEINFMMGCTVYLRMSGESQYDHAVCVRKFAVYDKYFNDLSSASGYDFAIAAIDISPDKVSKRTWDSKFNTLPSIFSKLRSGHKIRIAGYPGEKPKNFQAHEMEGAINEIKMTDDNHGIMMYTNIDTSQGQSGSMVLLTEEPLKVAKLVDMNSGAVKKFPVNTKFEVRLRGTNVGVHCGGEPGKNWATIITPTIM